MICKYCNAGNSLPDGKDLHQRCKVFWDVEDIPREQKRILSICPHCGEKFYYWQHASLHAKEMKHWGCYVPNHCKEAKV